MSFSSRMVISTTWGSDQPPEYQQEETMEGKCPTESPYDDTWGERVAMETRKEGIRKRNPRTIRRL